MAHNGQPEAIRGGSTLEIARAAIAGDLPVSFRYQRSDGMITRHNAVYPKQVFEQGHHTMLRAYCHFTRDSRLFRVDRIDSIRLRARVQKESLGAKIVGVLFALAILAVIFATLLLFSPKYRWRRLRHQLLGHQSHVQIHRHAEGLHSAQFRLVRNSEGAAHR